MKTGRRSYAQRWRVRPGKSCLEFASKSSFAADYSRGAHGARTGENDKRFHFRGDQNPTRAVYCRLNHCDFHCDLWRFLVSQQGIGEGGIRTLGTLLRYGALAKRCFRPLSHLTKISGGQYASKLAIANMSIL